MRSAGLQMLLALCRLPVIGWHLGRAGTLGHLARVSMLPGWMRRICKLADMMIRSRSARSDAGAALAEALIRLGPGFIKFGQALSTRSDLVGPEMALSLSQLQDRLPPFSSRLARAQIETELGTTLDSVFSQFNPDPVAAASIAQVHKAALKDGRQVAVKLLRPGIRRRMQADTSLFYSLARILEWLAPDLRRLKLVTAVDQ
ncbi:MAG: AarF/UbiB family protein, partial [Alphaproteobacteria bacterium]|nr:AarF/UbiB family protein [Alphaproteobacteria bacterium]